MKMPNFKSMSFKPSVRGVLIVSLAMNVLVIAIVIGGIVDGKPPRGFSGYDMTLGPVGKALDHERRDKIRKDLRERDDLRPSREEFQAANDRFISILTADEFDSAAALQLFASQRQRANAAMEAGQLSLISQIEEMDIEERLDFAKRLQRGGKKDR